MTKWGLLLSAVAFLLLASHSGAAVEIRNGNSLLKSCRAALNWVHADRSVVPAGQCFAYVRGVVDGNWIAAAFAARRHKNTDRVSSADIRAYAAFCKPRDVTEQDVAWVIVRYLERYPEDRPLDAEIVTALALREAYPCHR